MVARLIKLGEGVLLGREPRVEDYTESGLRPFHIMRSWQDVPNVMTLTSYVLRVIKFTIMTDV